MARKRYFKSLGRRYYRKSRKWRSFSRYNYNNLKIDCNFHVQYPTNTGEAVIYFSDSVNNKYYGLGQILDKTDWVTFKPLYQFFRVRGIRFDCTPMSCNAGQEGITQSSGVYLGWCLTNVGSDASQTSWLTDTDRAIVLNPLQKTTKYWSTFGAQDDWKTTSTSLSGNISVYSSETSSLNAAPVWHVKATFYISVKMANK